MDNTSTQELIIQYIYNELNTSQQIEVEQLLASNFEVKEMYNSFLESVNSLPKALFNPPQESVDKILNYSASTQLEHTRN